MSLQSAPTSIASPAASPRRGLLLLLALLLSASTFILYWQTRNFEFINFDDDAYLMHAPIMQGPVDLSAAKRAFTEIHHGNWHPVTTLIFLLEKKVFGFDSARPWHLVNAALHAIDAGLMLLVLWQMTGTIWRSAIVAALFAFHPLHVESVAWVSELKDVLSVLFLLLTVAAYARFVRRRSGWMFVLALAMYAIGLMCKPTLVTLPILLLLLDFWPLERLDSLQPPKLLRIAADKLPFVFLAAASSAITWIVQSRSGATTPGQTLSLAHRLGNALMSYVMYVFKTIWPLKLAAFYQTSAPLAWWPVALLGLLAVTVAVVLLARRFPYLLVGWMWFFVSLIPMIGLVQVGRQAMADRYTYISIIGLFIAATWGLYDLVNGRAGARATFSIGTSAILVLLSALTFRQTSYWHDSERLFRHALDVTGPTGPAEFIVAKACHLNGRIDEAIERYESSIRVLPDGAAAYEELGEILLQQRRFTEAVDYLTRGAGILDADLQASPLSQASRGASATAHATLGQAYARQQDDAHALDELHRALQIDPQNRFANVQFARILYDMKRYREAAAQAQATLRIDPNVNSAHQLLGLILLQDGQFDAAMNEFHAAFSTGADERAAFETAMALQMRGHAPEAVNFYRIALAVNPHSLAANNLAWILSTYPDARLRNGTEAVRLAETSPLLQVGDRASALDTLAAAYAEAGDFDKAVAAATDAIQLAQHENRSALAQEIDGRATFYRIKMAYRDPAFHAPPK